MEDDDVDFFLTGDDVKNMTQTLDKQVKEQQQLINMLEMENIELKQENEKLKESLKIKQNQNIKNAIDIIKCLQERSKVIEENQIMKELIRSNNLSDVINMFSWKCEGESSKQILELKQQKINLEQMLKNANSNINISNFNKSVNEEFNENKIKSQKSIIEDQTRLINEQEQMIKQHNDSLKEKYFIAEVVLNYIEGLNDSQKDTKVKEYIEYIVDLLNQFVTQNNIKHKIIFQN